MKNKKTFIVFGFVLLLSLALLVNAQETPTTICNSTSVLNTSNKILSSLVGNTSLSYYSYVGYKTNKIFYPKILNLTKATKDSYFVIVSYKFSHVLNTTTILKFILPNENECDKLIFYGGHNLVEFYNLSKIIGSQKAVSVAEQSNFNISNPQLTLIPSGEYKNKSSFLVPGYSGIQNSKIIYINALTSEVHTHGLVRPLKNPLKINSSKRFKENFKIKISSLKYFLILFFLILILIIYIIKKMKRVTSLKNEKK